MVELGLFRIGSWTEWEARSPSIGRSGASEVTNTVGFEVGSVWSDGIRSLFRL